MKTEFTITEAATLYGKSRNTLTAHIKKGTLSKKQNGKIELAELLRVYGALPSTHNEKPMSGAIDGVSTPLVAQLERQIAQLERQLEQAQAQITWLQGQVSDNAQRRIEHRPKRSILARLLGD
jgi:flagellar biosynthesis chaperone FliJ